MSKLRPGEVLSVFMHKLRKLLGQAMPDLEALARDQLLLQQLLTGLPPAFSCQLGASGEVTNLERFCSVQSW